MGTVRGGGWGTFMRYGRGIGRALGARLGRRVGFLLVLAGLAMPVDEMRAAVAMRPLDLHAVVLNGQVVGSTFAIADGVAVTNRHVVQGLAPGSRVRVLASGPGRAVAVGTLLAVSDRMDLAVLAVPKGILPVVPLDLATALPGDRVVAAGVDASEGSGWPRYEARGAIVMARAEIAAFGPGLIARLPKGRPGFSGGPLLDESGRLLGMVTALRTNGGPITPAASGGGAVAAPQIEAYALRAPDLRAEVLRLLGASRTGS